MVVIVLSTISIVLTKFNILLEFDLRNFNLLNNSNFVQNFYRQLMKINKIKITV